MRERATTALLLPASLALLLAIGIAALAHRETRLQRLVNALKGKSKPVYLIHRKIQVRCRHFLYLMMPHILKVGFQRTHLKPCHNW